MSDGIAGELAVCAIVSTAIGVVLLGSRFSKRQLEKWLAARGFSPAKNPLGELSVDSHLLRDVNAFGGLLAPNIRGFFLTGYTTRHPSRGGKFTSHLGVLLPGAAVKPRLSGASRLIRTGDALLALWEVPPTVKEAGQVLAQVEAALGRGPE